jgi:predicted F0F1-ATPase subunit
MESKPDPKKPKKGMKSFVLTSLGWELALPIFLGAFLGYQIDHKIIKSGYAFTIILVIVGIIIGYYNIYKRIELEVLRTKKEKKNQKDQED